MAGDARSECTVGEIAAPIRNALVGGPFGSDLVSDDYVATGVPVIRGANMGRTFLGGPTVWRSPAGREADRQVQRHVGRRPAAHARTCKESLNAG